MKTVWIKVIPWQKDLITEALENGADGVVVEEGRSAEVRELGIITTIAPDGDLKLGEDVPDMNFDRVWTDIQILGDLAISQTIGQSFQDCLFSCT